MERDRTAKDIVSDTLTTIRDELVTDAVRQFQDALSNFEEDAGPLSTQDLLYHTERLHRAVNTLSELQDAYVQMPDGNAEPEPDAPQLRLKDFADLLYSKVPSDALMANVTCEFVSYRGFYEQCAVVPSRYNSAPVTVSELYEKTMETIGSQLESWKSGPYRMDESTELWMAEASDASGLMVVGLKVRDDGMVEVLTRQDEPF